MNREDFYLEIGGIDDDLILAASEARGCSRRTVLLRVAGIAACFLLLFSGVLYGLRRDALYFNELPVPAAPKVTVPDDAGIVTVFVTYPELLAYYGLDRLPDAIGDLTRMDQTHFVLYQDQTGVIVYDTNTLRYVSPDSSMTLTVTLEKTWEPSDSGLRMSKISGVPVLLAVSAMDTDHTAYWAEFCWEHVTMQMTARGMNEETFLAAVRVLIGNR